MLRILAVGVVVLGCGNREGKLADPAPPAPVAVKPAGSAAPVAVAVPLEAGESVRAPAVETAWAVAGATLTATVLDRGDTSELVVWGDGKRHDVVTTRAPCAVGAELRHAGDTLVFRCETGAAADDWLIWWNASRGYPTRKRHWRGDGDEREPRWAASTSVRTGKGHHGRRCCCAAALVEGEVAERIDEQECRAAWAGRCVDDAQCADD
jgi:hypothetical protein